MDGLDAALGERPARFDLAVRVDAEVVALESLGAKERFQSVHEIGGERRLAVVFVDAIEIKGPSESLQKLRAHGVVVALGFVGTELGKYAEAAGVVLHEAIPSAQIGDRVVSAEIDVREHSQRV